MIFLIMNYRLHYILVVTLGVAFQTAAFAQRVIPESEIIELALKNSASVQAADLQVQQNKHLQKAGFNLPNPEVIAESPTGEFYAVGVLQSLEFPTVYIGQTQLRKQVTRLSEKQKEITAQDIKLLIHSLYLNMQVAQELLRQLHLRDSAYAEISRTAARQFDAGTIDYLAKTFASSQAGEVHNEWMRARYDLESARNQIKLYTGSSEDFLTTGLKRLNISSDLVDSTSISSNPSVQYYQQLRHVNAKALSVERQKALPGLVVGYLNQGARETDTYYRFRVGFTVPLWFWQYSGNIKAAKVGVKIAEQTAKAQVQSAKSEMIQAIADVKKYNESLMYYETNGLTQAEEIISTAKRFFESGQTDYIAYLRNINEAYTIKAKYLETLRNYNQSVITLNYLSGQL
jgi:outer membrane protein, heavy metal efflux system